MVAPSKIGVANFTPNVFPACLEVGAREVAELRQPRFDFLGWQQEMERDALGVVGFLRADLLLADPVLDRGQEVVANRHVERGERRHLDARGRFDAEHGGMAVGADEPARADALNATQINMTAPINDFMILYVFKLIISVFFLRISSVWCNSLRSVD